MNYQFDANKVTLDDLQKRIETTDLVPSRAPLMEGLASKFETLKQKGFVTLALLRNEFKSPTRLQALAKATGIDGEYLQFLRREVDSYFPKPCSMKEFSWFPTDNIEKLVKNGIHNTADLFEKAATTESRANLAQSSGVEAGLLDVLFRQADLTRVQWVNPTVARMLVDAGYDTPAKLENANPNVLCEALMTINKGAAYFKGNIGLRDIKRLVHSAKFATQWYAS